ncbi:heavy metal translocating P-type ATPase [Gimibacter soli]|uniref:Heavy metal translocating P-type ATPase n=1 Tax=Gimibacter soli TaxID=3024400 RepID=A0AAE9XUT6_9PROT|nr:heavy metal translocating P-type ATPase [Gimibacter soli]WCL54048.1 heavy metal translocating P-type ATPase [Gimibacter soli]
MSEAALNPYIRPVEGGLAEAELLVPSMHCAACISRIEKGLGGEDGIDRARANLTTHRVSVRFNPGTLDLDALVGKLGALGFPATPFRAAVDKAGTDREARRLLIALAVAGFATMNIMLFSVSVWDGSEMDMGTRGLFHWVSALIALLGISVAGQPFFRSAWEVLRTGHTNMDVPISLAVILSYFASIGEAMRGAEHVYFDAGVMLLFFLLIGRYLDHRMRAKASDAAQNLLALKAVPATVLEPDGTHRTMPADEVEKGALVLVATGMRVPVDGIVEDGTSDIDASLVTGETMPVTAGKGTKVFAGTLNLNAPIKVRVEGRGESTLLAEIVRLMEAAEQGRGRFVRLADRLARLYAPVVHILAAITFLSWWGLMDAHTGLMRAIAVLIITCPCALGLAVPVVQVVAAGRLLMAGVLIKAADGLERLATIDTVVFDKTGTLTMGELTLLDPTAIASTDLAFAGGLAAASRHPLAVAVNKAASKGRMPMFDEVREIPGAGIVGFYQGSEVRLGSRKHVGVGDDAAVATGPELWLKRGDAAPVHFAFADDIRPGAAEAIASLKGQGIHVMLLSGDRAEVAEKVAGELGITDWRGSCHPDDKIAALEDLKAKGAQVLMVGDGLNDAPALRAAHVSISPASGSDVTQTAADFVFQGKSLKAVTLLLSIAKRTKGLTLENFGLAIGYNVIAVPLAVLGHVTPMVAAIAMSGSSIVVVANALRLRRAKAGEEAA